MNKYVLIFDKVIIKQLQQAAKNNHIKQILTKMLNKIELLGPNAGKLLDSRLFIYEVKSKHPPIRLYFKYNLTINEIYVFEYEIKTSEQQQQTTINKIKKKVLDSKNLSLF